MIRKKLEQLGAWVAKHFAYFAAAIMLASLGYTCVTLYGIHSEINEMKAERLTFKDKWKAEGCWTYDFACEGYGKCSRPSPYKVPFKVDGVLAEPYQACKALEHKQN